MSTCAMRMVRACPADAGAVTRLVREAYGKWVPLIGREPMPMTVDYEWAIGRHDIDLVYEGTELLGLIETIPYDDHLFIENLAVAPEHQGRGVGRRLLRHAEETARAAGLFELRLLTNEAFASNVRLYLSAGYGIDGHAPFMGGTTVYLSKRL